MIDPLLQARLFAALERQRRVRLWCVLAGCWTALALAGLVFVVLRHQTGLVLPGAVPALVLVALGAASLFAVRYARAPLDWRGIARQVEAQYPELDGALLTAVQQHAPVGGALEYLQDRLVRQAVQHSQAQNWARTIPRSRLVVAHLAHLLALGGFLLVLWQLRHPTGQPLRTASAASRVTVTPGDASLERGASLVVLARFEGTVPGKVDLVLDAARTDRRRLPLVRSLVDPMFGASVPGVSDDLVYWLEYAGQRTREYRVKVFEYPRLERADAGLTYPDYTGLPPKRIADTRRVSAVEGTRLELKLQLNKPVTSARLVPRNLNSAAGVVQLLVESERATAALTNWSLANSGVYDLRLVDAEGRTNKVPAQFAMEVVPHRRPELKLASPRGDLRPSALEEINFAGTVWDDFGVRAYGLAYTIAGQETKFLELGPSVPGGQRQAFQHLLRLEDLAVQPDQFISWFLWADDLGPDGQVRRTTGDLFFAEVRPFEEIFREGQGSEAPPPDSARNPTGEQGSPSARVAELQKQIISATWKLQQRTDALWPGQSNTVALANRREPGSFSPYAKDAVVVREAQAQALEQATAAGEEADDARSAGFWHSATGHMQTALDRLTAATNSTTPLPQALTAEQAAYQALLKLQQREFDVARSRGRGQNAGARQRTMQRQLDQLDLAQAENRYETERQAQAPPTPARREQLQVLNRLRELARRQEDVNDRLKELQTALQEARTPAEREQARRRLERLQEDEQQVLADVDELRQRLERAENQSPLAEPRRQLEQTRDEVQRAADATGQGSVSQALAAGTRAQRQMQQMHDDLRRGSAGEVAGDLREMRAEARELSRRQEQIERGLEAATETRRTTLTDTAERQSLVDQLGQQRQRLTNLLERVSQVSQETENAEPLASTELYDSLRKFTQEDTGTVRELQDELVQRGLLTRDLADRLGETREEDRARSLQLTAELLRQGYLSQAGQTERRARSAINDLRQGVERAAGHVLGDDTESLRLAQRGLEQATAQLEAELFNHDVVSNPGPITGEDFGPWSDRLREVEELVELPSLRSQVATARERTRDLRREYRRDLKKPDWAVVRLQVMQPLAEVRDQIAEELARREPGDKLVPIDRDPVPGRYSELVRRYYEELGRAR